MGSWNKWWTSGGAILIETCAQFGRRSSLLPTLVFVERRESGFGKDFLRGGCSLPGPEGHDQPG